MPSVLRNDGIFSLLLLCIYLLIAVVSCLLAYGYSSREHKSAKYAGTAFGGALLLSL